MSDVLIDHESVWKTSLHIAKVPPTRAKCQRWHDWCSYDRRSLHWVQMTVQSQCDTYVCKYVCLSVWLSVWLSVCLSVRLSVCLPVCLSVYLSVCLFVFLFICLSVCLTLCLPLPPRAHRSGARGTSACSRPWKATKAASSAWTSCRTAARNWWRRRMIAPSRSVSS